MSTVTESATGATPLSNALAVGLANIAYNQTVTFRRYVRMVLPLDGYVFWVAAALPAGKSDVINASPINSVPIDGAGAAAGAAISLTAMGSVHYSTQAQQNEDGAPAINSIVFTATEVINDLNVDDPNLLWVGTWQGLQFAFSARAGFYQQANLYHYRGNALYSTMATQLIDAQSQLQPDKVIVSNSLPIWLTKTAFGPVFPSFAVPQQMEPPYIAVHIPPEATSALQPTPFIDGDSNSWQLTKDRVRFTLYGLRNQDAINFRDSLLNAAYDDSCPYGILSETAAAIRDEKKTQVEFQTLAQKKTFDLEVSYYQSAMNNVAQRLIREASIKLTIGA